MRRLASSLTYGVRVNYFPSLSTNKKQGAVSQVCGMSATLSQLRVWCLSVQQRGLQHHGCPVMGDAKRQADLCVQLNIPSPKLF